MKNKNITLQELRKFALTTGLMFILLFFLFFPWVFHKARPLWPFYVAGPLFLLAAVFPQGLRPIHKLWFKFAEVLGWVNSRIILSVLFFGVFMPMGWVRRTFFSKPKNQSQSHWIESTKNQSFNKPF